MMLRHQSDDERGVVLVLTAMFMVALLVVCAYVVDLAMLRSDRRADRTVADGAATAGALDLDGSVNSLSKACADAFTVALANLGFSPAATSSSCPTQFPAGATCSAGTPVSATGTISGVTITITIPVPDTSTLMSATAIGGDQTQAINTLDGTACQRIGVDVQRSRPAIFGAVAGTSSWSTDVHSVARYNPSSGGPNGRPALVALNKTACPSINAGPGTIHVEASGSNPGIIDSDSTATAPNCASSTTYNAGNSGHVIADTSTTGAPGLLGYSAPSIGAAFSAPSSSYQGTPLFEPPVTRIPVDTKYHCGNLTADGALSIPAGCTVGANGTDAISALNANYGGLTAATAAAQGWTVFPASGQSCNSLPATFAAPAVGWYINCPTFSVTSPVSFTSGNVIFAGNISLGSGADLSINAANAATTAPAGADAVAIIQGTTGIMTSSNTWTFNFYRTTVLMTSTACQTTIASCGTVSMQNGTANWTAPQASSTTGLIYWSETSQPITFQGNPSLGWNGLFFSPSAPFDLQGAATVLATNVQLWIDSVNLGNNSASLTLSPNTQYGLSTNAAGSALIR